MINSDEELEFGGFTTVLDRENSIKDEKSVFRAAIHSEQDAGRWLEEYSKTSRSEWIVKDTFPHHSRAKIKSPIYRLVYRKLYVCTFANKNKHLAEGSKRNWNCKAQLDIRIKLLTKETKKRDDFLKQEDPLQGIITVSHTHSHNTETFTAWRCLRAGNDLRQKFMEYYAEGSSPAAALALHAGNLELLDDSKEKLGDSHYMPLKQTAYYWHRLFRALNYGPPSNPFETLKSKIELYKQKGVTVVVQEESPWAILVVTPVMRRTHDLFWAKNIVFADTSSSCDSTSTNVTLMLTSTKAGAIPMVVLLHEGQSTESYRVAFQLFQETFPNAFGGETHPLTFMSDNSGPEKKALRLVWPDSLQLLCGFHVGQAEWEWINSNITKEQKKALMADFQEIQYANSTDSLEEKIKELKETALDYYNNRLEGLLNNKEEWVQLFRAHLPIGGHHTNNCAEASIRVLKDVILQRTKAFNVVALVDYIGVTWQKYLETRLSWYAYDRISKPEHLYHDLLKRMAPELAKDIECVEKGLYLVPSGTTKDLKYEVKVELGLCSCKAGAAGAFCKHQALLHKTYGGVFPNCPPITSADRYLIGVLAMGDSCPPKSCFLGMRETLDDLENNLKELQSLYAPSVVGCSPVQQETSSCFQSPLNTPALEILEFANEEMENIQSASDAPEVDAEIFQKHKQKFLENMSRLIDLGSETNSKGFLKLMNKTDKNMDWIKNSNKAYQAMMGVSAALKAAKGRSGESIHVQHKSIARRKNPYKGNKRIASGRPCDPVKESPVTLTQGSSVTPSGRPNNDLLKKKRQPTRKRALAASIGDGKRHIRKH
ncbi:hypothetical protein FOCC_FOCC013258 [Frankliniella occidentalis]|nr:hypothetical protein FOCC_FOCC013258 [Frankliniella occidentalis]